MRMVAAISCAFMPQEAFLRIAAFAHVLDPADSSLAAERLRGATRSFRGWMADAARRGGVRASWRAFYREFDALICPISPTAAFPHCHPLFESCDRSGDRKSQKKPRRGRRACLASVKQTHPRRGLLISQNRSSIKFDPRSREASGVRAGRGRCGGRAPSDGRIAAAAPTRRRGLENSRRRAASLASPD